MKAVRPEGETLALNTGWRIIDERGALLLMETDRFIRETEQETNMFGFCSLKQYTTRARGENKHTRG